MAIVRGAETCPVAAVRAWLDASGIADGAVFRPVTKDGHVRAGRPAPFSVARLVKQHAEAAGLDPAQYVGHSPRAGFITSAAQSGRRLDRIMAVTRHRKVATVMIYVREGDAFRNHAGSGLL